MTKQQRMDLYDILRQYIEVAPMFNDGEKRALSSLLVTIAECEKSTNYWFTINRCKKLIGQANGYNMED